jgi:hypothetical protein
VIVDPSDYGDNASLAIWSPSPDGKRLVVGISVGSAVTYRVIDVTSGKLIRDLGAHLGAAFFAWMPDSPGFYFHNIGMGLDADGRPAPRAQIWWQPESGEAQQQPLEIDLAMAWPQVSMDGRWILGDHRRHFRVGVGSSRFRSRVSTTLPLARTDSRARRSQARVDHVLRQLRGDLDHRTRRDAAQSARLERRAAR